MGMTRPAPLSCAQKPLQADTPPGCVNNALLEAAQEKKSGLGGRGKAGAESWRDATWLRPELPEAALSTLPVACVSRLSGVLLYRSLHPLGIMYSQSGTIQQTKHRKEGNILAIATTRRIFHKNPSSSNIFRGDLDISSDVMVWTCAAEERACDG
ncbi:hypothetical protein BC834DRAFT_85010 [Gloeopeniophorella convolvens]|nr:hypothetical protein BC834DRAFT_85010 [Gloeopeniophorella convolvens]